MKKKITKTVVIISSVAAALGILMCITGAAMNGSLNGIFSRNYKWLPEGERGYSFSIGGDDIHDDFYDDFFDDFFDDFDMHGGEHNETSL